MNYYKGKGRGYDHGAIYGDRDFINKQILKLPINIQGQVRVRYSKIYNSLNGRNDQRYRANTWLRKTVKKHGFIK